MGKVLGMSQTNSQVGQMFLSPPKVFSTSHILLTVSKGIAEAMQAGLTLKKHNYKFDIAFTSVLSRSIETYNSLIGVLG